MLAVEVHTLPIIQIAPFLNQDPNEEKLRASTAAALHKACVDYGFFYLDISAYIDPSVGEHLTQLARQFFALPQADKDRISIHYQDNARGYARLKENITNGKADNQEGIDFYKPVANPDKTRPIWGKNQWPNISDFKERYEEWIDKMKALGFIVMKAMAQGLGMTDDEWVDLRRQVDESFWSMRIIGYPPLSGEGDAFSCGAHKDYGCLTFLHTDPTPSALQVFSRHPGAVALKDPNQATQVGSQEGVWINADPIPGCVVCNIGSMWEIWTNGLYQATIHQVMHRGANYRVSIPFFFEPNFDAEIKPLDAALRLQKSKDKIEQVYKPTVYGEFLMTKVENNFAAGKVKYES